jgi:hypothetical protein
VIAELDLAMKLALNTGECKTFPGACRVRKNCQLDADCPATILPCTETPLARLARIGKPRGFCA